MIVDLKQAWHHSLVTALYSFLARAFFARVFGIISASVVLLSVAALADGRTPDPRTVLEVALPLGACLGCAWCIGLWRHQGAHIVVGNQGRSPAGVTALLSMLSLPLFCLGVPTTESATVWAMAITPEQVTISSPSGTQHHRWQGEGSIRRHGDQRSRTTAFPAPAGRSKARIRPWPVRRALPFLTLVVMVAWLAFRRSDPGLVGILLAAVSAWGAGRVLSMGLS